MPRPFGLFRHLGTVTGDQFAPSSRHLLEPLSVFRPAPLRYRPMRIATLLNLLGALALSGCEAKTESIPARDLGERVAQFTPAGSVLPTQQAITPAGAQVELPGLRPQEQA